jgi:hypothetical protein
MAQERLTKIDEKIEEICIYRGRPSAFIPEQR